MNNNPYDNGNQNNQQNNNSYNMNQNYTQNNNPYNMNQNYPQNNNPYDRNQNYQPNYNPYDNRNQNYQPEYNQYNNNPNQNQYIRKPSFSGLHIALIVIIIVLAVVIIALSSVMATLNKGGNQKNTKNNNTLISSETENETEVNEEEEENQDEYKEDFPEEEKFEGELAIPVLNKFNGSASDDGNGVMVRLDWNTVENADGYEVEATETEDNSTEPYKRKIITSDTYFETGSSVSVNITARVRAYNGDEENRVYGEWSEPVECNLKEFIKTKKIKVSSTPVYYVTINNYRLAMYNSPDYEFFAYDYIIDRGTYTITERNGRWGKLKSGKWINLDDADKQGWISSRGSKAYVATKKDPLTLRYAPTKTSKAVEYIPKDEIITVYNIDVDGWYYTYYKGKSGFVTSEYVNFGTPDKFEAYTMEINNYHLPVYKKASKSSDITRYINDRDTYTIVEHDDTNKWGKLKLGGWINLKDARTFGWKGSGETAYVSTKTDPLTLRYGPDTSAKKVTSIDKDEVITVHSTDIDGWYYAEYRGKTGFVLAKYVTLGEPETTSTTTETTETTTELTTTTTTRETEPPETEPPVTEPPYIETQPPVVETEPPYIETQPPVVETEPPYIETPPTVEMPENNDGSELW